MTAFGIPDRDAETQALAISDSTRMEAWEVAIEQAETLNACKALADRLYRRLELLRQRDACPSVERTALALLHNRMNEILARAPV